MTPRRDFIPKLYAPVPEPLEAEVDTALQVLNPYAAGIDIGEAEHWVAVPAHCDSQPVRRFGTFSVGLHALATWLLACGITTVAMESTGIYWITLFELLESRGLEVVLIDPRQAKRAPGRPKSDVLDSQWLQRLHTYGLLCGAFRPDEQVCVLRAYLRQRQMLISCAAEHIQHMQKALQQMNLKLTQVVSDITGVTGMAILKAILAGERDRLQLAKLRDPRCKHAESDIAKALEGTWRAEHLFALRQALELYEFYQQQRLACDQQIEAHLHTFADQSDGQPLPKASKTKKPKANAPSFDARTLLYQMSGVDLTAIEGIEASTALVVLSEIGTDMSRWPSVKQFSSWLGLSPQHRISGGRVLSRRVRPGAQRAALALRLAANSLHRSQSAMGAFFRRIKARHGTPKAITATAHKLARLIYSLLKNGSAYVQKEMESYEAQYVERKVKSMAKQAMALGYELVPVSAEA
jgi:transposase